MSLRHCGCPSGLKRPLTIGALVVLVVGVLAVWLTRSCGSEPDPGAAIDARFREAHWGHRINYPAEDPRQLEHGALPPAENGMPLFVDGLELRIPPDAQVVRFRRSSWDLCDLVVGISGKEYTLSLLFGRECSVAGGIRSDRITNLITSALSELHEISRIEPLVKQVHASLIDETRTEGLFLELLGTGHAQLVEEAAIETAVRKGYLFETTAGRGQWARPVEEDICQRKRRVKVSFCGVAGRQGPRGRPARVLPVRAPPPPPQCPRRRCR